MADGIDDDLADLLALFVGEDDRVDVALLELAVDLALPLAFPLLGLGDAGDGQGRNGLADLHLDEVFGLEFLAAGVDDLAGSGLDAVGQEDRRMIEQQVALDLDRLAHEGGGVEAGKDDVEALGRRKIHVPAEGRPDGALELGDGLLDFRSRVSAAFF